MNILASLGKPFLTTERYSVWTLQGGYFIQLNPTALVQATQDILKKDGMSYFLFDPTGKRQLARIHGPLDAVFGHAAEALARTTGAQA